MQIGGQGCRSDGVATRYLSACRPAGRYLFDTSIPYGVLHVRTWHVSSYLIIFYSTLFYLILFRFIEFCHHRRLACICRTQCIDQRIVLYTSLTIGIPRLAEGTKKTQDQGGSSCCRPSTGLDSPKVHCRMTAPILSLSLTESAMAPSLRSH